MQDRTLGFHRDPLDLPQVRVLSQEGLPGEGIAVRVVLRPEVRSCPACGRLTGKVHDREEQAKGDVSLGGRRLLLLLVKRRFRCPFCKKVFTEPDEVCGWRRRLTKRFRNELYPGGQALDGEAGGRQEGG